LGLDDLRHLVVLMIENRSFDHMLGGLKAGPGIDIYPTAVRTPPRQGTRCFARKAAGSFGMWRSAPQLAILFAEARELGALGVREPGAAVRAIGASPFDPRAHGRFG